MKDAWICIYPSIHQLLLILLGVMGVTGAYLNIFGRRWGTTWTSHQFITGLTCRDKQPSTLTFTPTGNLK